VGLLLVPFWFWNKKASQGATVLQTKVTGSRSTTGPLQLSQISLHPTLQLLNLQCGFAPASLD